MPRSLRQSPPPRLIDLSHPRVHGAAAFPHDPKLAIISHGTGATHGYNISPVLIFRGRDGPPVRAVAVVNRPGGRLMGKHHGH